MKLLYFTHSLHNSGGIERVLTTKINYLADILQYNIVIVTTEQMNRHVFFPLSEKIKLYHLDIDFDGDFNSNIFKRIILHQKKKQEYKGRAIEIIAIENPDICISTFSKEVEFICKLKDKSKKVGEIHFSKNFREQFLVAQKQNIFWKYAGKIRTFQLIKSAKKLDKLIVLTQADKIDWEKTNNNIVQIYNPNPLENQQKSNCVNKKAIAVGKLDVQKGFDILIDVWKNIAVKNSDWVLEIWGDGELRQKLTKQIDDNGLSNNILLKGRTNDVQNKYLESSFYIMTSRYEGLGMVLIEAMSCGLPCIAFDCQWGPGEIIKDGVNGFLVPMGDYKQMVECITTLINDEKLRQTMSEQAKLTSERFNLPVIMRQWDSLFKTLCCISTDRNKF
jgi:glycosyltransferase involved in cell wall biosynthesis